MIKTLIKYCLVFTLVVFIAACSSESESLTVAKVGEKSLTQSDISEMLPKNSSKEDSATFANDYIQKWVKQELILQKAYENLSPEQKDLKKEIQEYRNSLILYKYKNELMKQRMDTVVTLTQVEEYYNAHPKDFNLDRSIVKGVFVKIPVDLANTDMLKEMMMDDSEEGQSELREYCLQFAKKFDISIDKWMDFYVLNRNLPVLIEKPEEFLRKNSFEEMSDSTYYYLVNIYDYKLSNDLAPLEFVENNIKNLILNQRKIRFLKDLEENVYTEGVRQNKFKIYDRKTKKQE